MADFIAAWCKKGALAKQGSKVGEVTMDPDSDGDVKVCWSDGTQSGYIKAVQLSKPTIADQKAACEWCKVGAVGDFKGQVGVVTLAPDGDAEIKLKKADGTMVSGAGSSRSYVKAVLVHPASADQIASFVRQRMLTAAHKYIGGQGLTIEGHPLATYNGVYRVTCERDGWPVLKNAAGIFCYHYAENHQWFLRNKFTPESVLRNSYIAAAADGTIPMGGNVWKYYTTEDGWSDKWVTTSLLAAWCKKGELAKQGSKVGEVTMDPDSDGDVKVCWSDGTQSGYIKAVQLSKPTIADQKAACEWCKVGAVGDFKGQVGVVTLAPDGDAEIKLKKADGTMVSGAGLSRSYVKAVLVHPASADQIASFVRQCMLPAGWSARKAERAGSVFFWNGTESFWKWPTL